MSLGRQYILLVFLMGLLITSCEKAERPIVLPPKGSANLQSSRVDMGIDYEDQICFDLESGQAVMTSKVASWDLAFESSPDGFHVFLNGGRKMFMYNSHTTNPEAVTDVDNVRPTDWLFDRPCGLPDSTAIGDWRDGYGASRNEVMVLRINDDIYKKIVIADVKPDYYV